MAATVMTFKFGTIHYYSSLEENSEASLCSPLDRYKSELNNIQIVTFWFRITMFKTETLIQISLIPTLCTLNKN